MASWNPWSQPPPPIAGGDSDAKNFPNYPFLYMANQSWGVAQQQQWQQWQLLQAHSQAPQAVSTTGVLPATTTGSQTTVLPPAPPNPQSASSMGQATANFPQVPSGIPQLGSLPQTTSSYQAGQASGYASQYPGYNWTGSHYTLDKDQKNLGSSIGKPPLPVAPPPPLPSDSKGNSMPPPPPPTTPPPLPKDTPQINYYGQMKENASRVNSLPDPEMDESEKIFEMQFKKWEEDILAWKKEHQNHPDKAAFAKYEAQWEEWKKQLLERREQLKMNRLRRTGRDYAKPADFNSNKVNTDLSKMTYGNYSKAAVCAADSVSYSNSVPGLNHNPVYGTSGYGNFVAPYEDTSSSTSHSYERSEGSRPQKNQQFGNKNTYKTGYNMGTNQQSYNKNASSQKYCQEYQGSIKGGDKTSLLATPVGYPSNVDSKGQSSFSKPPQSFHPSYDDNNSYNPYDTTHGRFDTPASYMNQGHWGTGQNQSYSGKPYEQGYIGNPASQHSNTSRNQNSTNHYGRDRGSRYSNDRKIPNTSDYPPNSNTYNDSYKNYADPNYGFNRPDYLKGDKAMSQDSSRGSMKPGQSLVAEDYESIGSNSSGKYPDDNLQNSAATFVSERKNTINHASTKNDDGSSNDQSISQTMDNSTGEQNQNFKCDSGSIETNGSPWPKINQSSSRTDFKESDEKQSTLGNTNDRKQHMGPGATSQIDKDSGLLKVSEPKMGLLPTPTSADNRTPLLPTPVLGMPESKKSALLGDHPKEAYDDKWSNFESPDSVNDKGPYRGRGRGSYRGHAGQAILPTPNKEGFNSDLNSRPNFGTDNYPSDVAFPNSSEMEDNSRGGFFRGRMRGRGRGRGRGRMQDGGDFNQFWKDSWGGQNVDAASSQDPNSLVADNRDFKTFNDFQGHGADGQDRQAGNDNYIPHGPKNRRGLMEPPFSKQPYPNAGDYDYNYDHMGGPHLPPLPPIPPPEGFDPESREAYQNYLDEMEYRFSAFRDDPNYRRFQEEHYGSAYPEWEGDRNWGKEFWKEEPYWRERMRDYEMERVHDTGGDYFGYGRDCERGYDQSRGGPMPPYGPPDWRDYNQFGRPQFDRDSYFDSEPAYDHFANPGERYRGSDFRGRGQFHRNAYGGGRQQSILSRLSGRVSAPSERMDIPIDPDVGSSDNVDVPEESSNFERPSEGLLGRAPSGRKQGNILGRTDLLNKQSKGFGKQNSCDNQEDTFAADRSDSFEVPPDAARSSDEIRTRESGAFDERSPGLLMTPEGRGPFPSNRPLLGDYPDDYNYPDRPGFQKRLRRDEGPSYDGTSTYESQKFDRGKDYSMEESQDDSAFPNRGNIPGRSPVNNRFQNFESDSRRDDKPGGNDQGNSFSKGTNYKRHADGSHFNPSNIFPIPHHGDGESSDVIQRIDDKQNIAISSKESSSHLKGLKSQEPLYSRERPTVDLYERRRSPDRYGSGPPRKVQVVDYGHKSVGSLYFDRPPKGDTSKMNEKGSFVDKVVASSSGLPVRCTHETYDLLGPRSLEQKPEVVLIDDILNPPGRYLRPANIVVILRGAPGSGKTFVAKLIKDKEVEHTGNAPRILSLDDYFMVESDDYEIVEEGGRKVKKKKMEYQFEPALETHYRLSLIKSFKKQVDDGYFTFIIVDCLNYKLSHFQEMVTYAKQKGFQVYIAELEADPILCHKRNTHDYTLKQIEDIITSHEKINWAYTKLDVRSMLQDAAITDVEMVVDNDKEEDNKDSVKESGEDEDLSGHVTSKWEKMELSEEKLDKLDGLRMVKKRKGDSEPKSVTDWLQDNDDFDLRPTQPGKKRVHWADIEARKEQKRARAMGFVVGQTDWNRMTDPTFGESALTKTKYI